MDLRATAARGRPEARGYAKNLPDGVAVMQDSRLAIEVELHFKGRRATEAVLAGHARNYDATFYFCAPGPYRQLGKLAESGRFPKLAVRELQHLKDL